MDEDDAPDFVTERAGFERAGGKGTDILNTLIQGDGKLSELNKKLARLNLTDEEKFQVLVRGTYYVLKDTLNLGENNLEILLSNIPKIKYPHTRNAGAYILGYYILKNGQVSKEKLKIVENNALPLLDGVTLEDCIRYIRWWLKHS